MGLLVALLLPLQGVSNAFLSIQSPAHYHQDMLALALVAAPPVHIPVSGQEILLDLHELELHEDGPTDHDGHEAMVGHHAHAFDDPGVAYVNDDSGSADQGAAGKHVASSGEAPLPAWSMPLLAMRGRPALPEPGCAFHSQRDEPRLRPPWAVTELIA